jgi:hypothetical protein
MPTLSGDCAYGAIRYTSEGNTLFALSCHCRDCQRESGAPSCRCWASRSVGSR